MYVCVGGGGGGSVCANAMNGLPLAVLTRFMSHINVSERHKRLARADKTLSALAFATPTTPNQSLSAIDEQFMLLDGTFYRKGAAVGWLGRVRGGGVEGARCHAT